MEDSYYNNVNYHVFFIKYQIKVARLLNAQPSRLLNAQPSYTYVCISVLFRGIHRR